MASNIKGITIQIGGDTTDLSKALSSINSESKSLQSELKQVDKLLKLDDTNITLCEQKEELLTEAIAATEEKLQMLKEAEVQVQEQFENGEVSEEQYRALERQIAQTEIELNNYQSELKEVQSRQQDTASESNDMGEAFKDAGQKAEEMGENGESGINLIATALETAGIVTALKEAAEAMGELASTSSNSTEIIAQGTGATGKALDSLSASLKKVYMQVSDADSSMDDTAEVLAELNTRTGETDETLEDLTLQFMEFAEQTGTDGVSAVDSVCDVMKKWGIETADTTDVLDLLTVAGQSCSMSIDEITGYLTDNKAQFDALGYSIEDSTALLVSLSDSGANTSTIMTGMRSAISTLSETTDDVPGAFAKMIKAIENCDDATSALQLVVDEAGNTVEDVFGTRASQEIINAVQSGNFALEDWQKALSDTSGALAETAEASNSMEDTWAQATNALSLTFSEIFEPVIKEVVSVVALLISKFTEILEACPALKAVVVALATAFGLLAAALAISQIIDLVKTAMVGLNTSMLALPTTWIIVGIAALVAAFIYLWNNCEEFREFWLDLWDKIKAIFQSVVEYLESALVYIKERFSSAWDAIKAGWDMVAGYFEAIWATIKGIFSAVKSVLHGDFSGAWTAIKGVVGTWVSYFSNVWAGIKNVFGSVASFFSGIFKLAYSAIKSAFNNVTSFFSGVITKIKNLFVGLGTQIGNAIRNSLKSAINGVLSSIETAINGAVKLINSMISLINKIPGVSIGTVSSVSLPRLAKGGVLGEGSAIVGEAGAELLSIVNGKTVVTPLTSGLAQNNIKEALGSAGNTVTQNINITSNREMSYSEIARQTRNATRNMIKSLQRA